MNERHGRPDGVVGERVGRGYRVHGHVQGVGFRWWTRRIAESLGVAGWVRNDSDGSVVVMARGSAQTLDRLYTALRQGAPMSRVDRVEMIPCTIEDDVVHFTIEQ